MNAFGYARPNTLKAAVDLLAAPGSMAIAGGQTLLPTIKQGLAAPDTLIAVDELYELRGIKAAGDSLTIGAATRHAEVAGHPDVWTLIPALSSLADRIGDPQVRNRGTLGGSLANNDPAACYPAAVLALGATVVTDRRELAAADFFTGLFETALEEGEVITAVRFPVPAAAAYEKMRQPASRFAMVGVFAARMRDGAVRIGVTGAGDGGVFRWSAAEDAMNGGAGALEGMSPDPGSMLSDLHADAAYRAQLVGVMTRRAVAAISDKSTP